MTNLFTPFTLQGGIKLQNRIAMAPMTRARAPQGTATESMALYYTQRATAGLIINEGTVVSSQGRGYLFSPGLYTPEQVQSWKLATNSVHDVGGKIFAQLWHVGRVSSSTVQPHGGQPVSCTAQIAANAKCYGYDADGKPGLVPVSAPRALTAAEVHQTADDFANAAENAVKAGFDGVEIHGANGYLLDQFMNPLVNDRTDEYSAETMAGRLRFTLEVVDKVIERVGAARTALRLSPYVRAFDMPLYDGIDATFTALARELAERKLAFLDFMDHSRGGLGRDAALINPKPEQFDGVLRHMREHMAGTPFMVAGGMTRERAEAWIAEGLIDLPAFGRAYISNPDLVARLQSGAPLAKGDSARFYGGGADGYIDYPPASGL